MGGVSADFAKFKDWTSKKWMARSWQDKLAAGFTVSASWGGDKQNTIYQLLTLAQQHGMVWVGLGLAPGNNHSKGSTDDLNRTGASLGVMAQANADQGNEGIGASEFRTAQALGKRVAEAALRWQSSAARAGGVEPDRSSLSVTREDLSAMLARHACASLLILRSPGRRS